MVLTRMISVRQPLNHKFKWWKSNPIAFARHVPCGSRLPPINNDEEQTAVRYDTSKGWHYYTVMSGNPHATVGRQVMEQNSCLNHKLHFVIF